MIYNSNELTNIKSIRFEGGHTFGSISEYKIYLTEYDSKIRKNPFYFVINNQDVVILLDSKTYKIGLIRDDKITIMGPGWLQLSEILSDDGISCEAKIDLLFLLDKF